MSNKIEFSKANNANGVMERKNAFLEVIQYKGSISATAKELGFTPHCVYKWMDDDKEFKAEVEAARRVIVDLAEEKLMEKIKAGDSSSIQFALSNLGGKRGYGNRIEINQQHDVRVVIEGIDTDDIIKIDNIEDIDYTDIEE